MTAVTIIGPYAVEDTASMSFEEASTTQLMLTCPRDGDVEVTIEDVTSVVLYDPEVVEVVFECPVCGERIGVRASVPSLLAAAIEALQSDEDEAERRLAGFLVVARGDGTPGEAAEGLGDPDRIDSYCEYFRRELDAVSCVEDALAEIDSA